MCKTNNKENKDKIKWKPSTKRLKERKRSNRATDGFLDEWLEIVAMPRK